MRKFLALILVAALFLPLSATTVPAQEDAPQTKGFVYRSEPMKEGPYTIGLSNFSVGNSWRVQMVAEARWEAEQHPEVEELIVTNAQGSISKQISDIEDMITQGVDAIILTAISPKP